MSDLSIRLTAEKLGKSIENASKEVESQIKQAVENLANAAYSGIIANVQNMSMDPKNRQDYLRGLKFQELGNDQYMIYLDGEWANKLEDGFSSYSIKEKLLRSEKVVSVGKRAGEKWVRTSKEGKKYAAVPFEHKPYAAKSGDLASEIKKLHAFNRQGERQKITETFRDDFGKPIVGKVATAISDGTPKNLQGLTKYQYVGEKGKVSSIYTTYRIVHEESGGWVHPGHSGYHFFEEAEKIIEEELENIVKALL